MSNSQYYKKKFNNICSNTISLDNIQELPFTDKTHIEDYNDDFIAVPQNKIVDIVLSSGTTGKPTKIVYTEKDLQRLAYNEEKSLKATGITDADIVLLTCTIDRCFIAGLAYFQGLRNIGASVIRSGAGTIESHIKVIEKLKPTVIVGVPTFLKKLGLYLYDIGIKPEKLHINKLVCIGEPIKDSCMQSLYIADELQKIWNAKVYSTYASTETITTFCECEMQSGGHLLPDLGIVEIIDKNGNSLPAGESGEVVVTPLQMEGIPLVRYKTGDISFIIDEPCACGRNSLRIGPIIGRKKQMLKVQGTTIYPQAVFAVLEELEFIAGYFIEVSKSGELSDRVDVFITLDNSFDGAERVIIDKLKARLRVKLNVVLIDKDKLNQRVFKSGSRKPVRFFDKRVL